MQDFELIYVNSAAILAFLVIVWLEFRLRKVERLVKEAKEGSNACMRHEKPVCWIMEMNKDGYPVLAMRLGRMLLICLANQNQHTKELNSILSPSKYPLSQN